MKDKKIIKSVRKRLNKWIEEYAEIKNGYYKIKTDDMDEMLYHILHGLNQEMAFKKLMGGK